MGGVGDEEAEPRHHQDKTEPEEELDAENEDWVWARGWEEPGGAGAAAAMAGLVFGG